MSMFTSNESLPYKSWAILVPLTRHKYLYQEIEKCAVIITAGQSESHGRSSLLLRSVRSTVNSKAWAEEKTSAVRAKRLKSTVMYPGVSHVESRR